DPRARFSFKQARMGVTTAWGTIPRLVSLVGHGAASRLLLTAHEVGANEAHEIGLADAVSDMGGAVALALAWAHDVCAVAPKAVGELKTLLRIARERPTDVGAEETKRFVDTWTGPEHAAAIEAYFSRKPPRWPAS
ncbi:MAG: enoyl-CoA hydratase-related protein, partial [Polyangiaceae bacterium]